MSVVSWFVLSPAASASVVTTGACSDGSSWAMEAVLVGGRIEVEFEVVSWVRGETWDVSMWQNGVSFFSGQRVTRGSDGEFWIERSRPNRRGVDTFEAVAVNLATGETCEGELRWTL